MIYVVCGPPGSGKTSYVQERLKYGDLIVDLDALYHALTNLPFYENPNSLLDLVLAVREFVLINLPKYEDRFYDAWVIVSGSRLEQRNRLAARLGAQVIVLEVSAGECLRRIGRDPRRKAKVADWEPVVHRWWNTYERCEGDTIVKPAWDRDWR